MNLEHKEKQEVFDFYARSQGFESWIKLDGSLDYYTYLNHLFNATDLVQRKALERASENSKIKVEEVTASSKNGEYHRIDRHGNFWKFKTSIDKESITNENNLIK